MTNIICTQLLSVFDFEVEMPRAEKRPEAAARNRDLRLT